jgi:hypothetical protein
VRSTCSTPRNKRASLAWPAPCRHTCATTVVEVRTASPSRTARSRNAWTTRLPLSNPIRAPASRSKLTKRAACRA